MTNSISKNIRNVDTTNISSNKEFQIINSIIDLETKRKICLVPEAKDFGVLTACYINNEFILVSTYDLSNELMEKLKIA
jgi:hypothetical protein